MTPDRRTPDDADGGLDDLFADDRFQEYDDALIGNPFVDEPAAGEPAAGQSAADKPAAGQSAEPAEQATDAVAEPAYTPAASTTPFVSGEPAGVPRVAPLAPGSYPGAPAHQTAATTVIPGAAAATGAQPGYSSSATVQPGATPTGSVLRPAKKKFSLTRFWAGLNSGQKVIAWAAVGIVLIFVVAALFSLGTLLPGMLPDEPVPDETSEAVGPLAPGTYQWDELRGGECLDPYSDVWAQEFTVVDCGPQHPAQFAYRGYVGPEVTVYLDAEGWQGLTTTLCDGATLLDYSVASEFGDLQWQLSYAGDATEWANGDRSYGCFLTRASGDQLTGSLIRDDVPVATPPPSQEPTNAP